MNNVVNGIPYYKSMYRFKFDAINIRCDKRTLPLKTTFLTICLRSIDEINVTESEHRSLDNKFLFVNFLAKLYSISNITNFLLAGSQVFLSLVFGIKINPFYQVQTGPYDIRYT